METTTNYRYELSDFDRDRLSAASAGIDAGFSTECPGVNRYAFYRRHGHGVIDSFTYAMAWLRNASEQYDRRLGHGTGAEGWRPTN